MMVAEAPQLKWPARYGLFGVSMSATTYDESLKLIMEAARRNQGTIVTHLPVHGVVEAARDKSYREKINAFDLVCPDGMPVRWALNKFYKTELPDRVYGPELMMRLCKKAAETGVGVYLYGSTPDVVERLKNNLIEKCPGLKVVGAESPPFRPLSVEEDRQVVERINATGAGLVFLGLGCPRQDIFAFHHRDRINAVLMCVGAAFDFHAGTKKTAPSWMQNHGLEWLFRLTQEPGRLWKRYLVTNSIFSALVLRKMILG